VKFDGLDYVLYHYPSVGPELRKALQNAESSLFNCKAELIFAVDKLTYGERPKVVYKGREGCPAGDGGDVNISIRLFVPLPRWVPPFPYFPYRRLSTDHRPG
jgi:hypothetical protein